MRPARPVSVTLLVIWSVLAGFLVIVYGIGYVSDGSTGLNSPRNTHLLHLWGGYFRTYIWIGLLWILTRLGSVIAAPGLWNGRNWGRKLGILCAVGTIGGWLVIKIACLHFDVPPPMVVLIVALSMGCLFAPPIQAFCSRN